MRNVVLILSLALALAGCLKVPESDNTGLLLPLAAPDTGSILTVGGGYVTGWLGSGETRQLSFPTEANAAYLIRWDEVSDSNALDVVVTARTGDGLLLYEQESSTQFNRIDRGLTSARVVVAGSTSGVYYLDVAGYWSYTSGQFAIRVDKISRPITVESAAGASPTTDTLVEQEGYARYYSLVANASTTYRVKWGDSGQGPGGLKQNVSVSLGRLTPTGPPAWAFRFTNSGWSTPSTYSPSSAGLTYIAVTSPWILSGTQTPPGFQIEVY